MCIRDSVNRTPPMESRASAKKSKTNEKGMESIKGVLDSFITSVTQVQRERIVEREKQRQSREREREREEKEQQKREKADNQKMYYHLDDKIFELQHQHELEPNPAIVNKTWAKDLYQFCKVSLVHAIHSPKSPTINYLP